MHGPNGSASCVDQAQLSPPYACVINVRHCAVAQAEFARPFNIVWFSADFGSLLDRGDLAAGGGPPGPFGVSPLPLRDAASILCRHLFLSVEARSARPESEDCSNAGTLSFVSAARCSSAVSVVRLAPTPPPRSLIFVFLQSCRGLDSARLKKTFCYCHGWIATSLSLS